MQQLDGGSSWFREVKQQGRGRRLRRKVTVQCAAMSQKTKEKRSTGSTWLKFCVDLDTWMIDPCLYAVLVINGTPNSSSTCSGLSQLELTFYRTLEAFGL
jgi:hypothetical protein